MGKESHLLEVDDSLHPREKSGVISLDLSYVLDDDICAWDTRIDTGSVHVCMLISHTLFLGVCMYVYTVCMYVCIYVCTYILQII